MRPVKFLLLIAVIALIGATPRVHAVDEPLAFDATTKEYSAKPGEITANFSFGVTNISEKEVVIDSVRTSCGCTVAKLPSTPWVLAPGTNGQIAVSVDLRGKFGTITKIVTVNTVSAGPKMLTIKVNIPQATAAVPGGNDSRVRNMQMAMADRQAVFKNDCASCHVLPTVGKTGAALYQTACAICHESQHRATMVPDLHALKTPPNRDFWTLWVCYGKSNSLMPGFAKSEGGPLSEEQIKSLVDYLSTSFPQNPAIPPTPAQSALQSIARIPPQQIPLPQPPAQAVPPPTAAVNVPLPPPRTIEK